MSSLNTYTQIRGVVVVVPCMSSRYVFCDNEKCERCQGKGEYQETMPFDRFVSLINEENTRDDD